MGNDGGGVLIIIAALLRLFLIITFFSVFAIPDAAAELLTMADTPLTSAPKVTLLLDNKSLVDDDEATLAELPTRSADFNDGNGAAANGAAAVVDDVVTVVEFLLSKKSPAPPPPPPLSPLEDTTAAAVTTALGRLNCNTKSSSPVSLAIILIYVERFSPFPPAPLLFLLPESLALGSRALLLLWAEESCDV